MYNTVVVNLFAGAGAGKTTCAWEIASELKKRNIETEYVSEYAKELVWDNKLEMLDGSVENQKIIHNEQVRRIERLIGKVQVVVTDSPTLLSLAYVKTFDKVFVTEVLNQFNANNNFNLFIKRGKAFQQVGRIHSLEESKLIDEKILTLLKDNNIYYGVYNHNTMSVVVENIIKNLKNTARKDIENEICK